jgi:hypothetical protein
LGGHGEVGIHYFFGIVDVLKLRFRIGAGAAALDIVGAVYFAGSAGVDVAHGDEGGVGVAEIVLVRECYGSWLGDAGGGILVDPVAGLNIVLRSVRRGAASLGGAARGGAQALKKIYPACGFPGGSR